ncbi:hypothetical protein E2C01_025708 [Portunus trituberculatus]|uniref:Uncharacterized protein n=1 Tax=Portunus trituberculatus TaxID=210409 RepID=A0A5B7EG62_PORTR|nr:hypothetical protein [Portunus trituberculatus]
MAMMTMKVGHFYREKGRRVLSFLVLVLQSRQGRIIGVV